MSLPPELREHALALIHTRPGPDAVRRVAAELHITPATLRNWLRYERGITGLTPAADASAAVAFPESLIRQAYGASLDTLCRRWSLTPIAQVPSLHSLRSYQRRILIAANRRFARRLHPSVVIASLTASGPIQRPADVSYGTIAEIIIAITTARWLTRPCVLYAPPIWSPMAGQIRGLVDTILADLDTPPPVTVVDTGQPAVIDLCRDAADEHADHLAALCDSAAESEARTIRAAVRYLPRVVGELIGRTVRHVILAEAPHRARGAAVAHRLASSHGHYVDILAHTPRPAGAVPHLGDALEATTRLLAAAPAAARRYWAAIWDIHINALTAGATPDLAAMAAYYRHLAESCPATCAPDGPDHVV